MVSIASVAIAVSWAQRICLACKSIHSPSSVKTLRRPPLRNSKTPMCTTSLSIWRLTAEMGEATYVIIHDLPGGNWRCAGKTQAARAQVG